MSKLLVPSLTILYLPFLYSLFPWMKVPFHWRESGRREWSTSSSLRPISHYALDFAAPKSLRFIYFLSVVLPGAFTNLSSSVIAHCLAHGRCSIYTCLMNESPEFNPFQMTAHTLPGCNIELLRTAYIAKVHVIFLKDSVRGPIEWFRWATTLDIIWLSGKMSLSHSLDFAKEVIFSDFSCLKNLSHNLFIS